MTIDELCDVIRRRRKRTCRTWRLRDSLFLREPDTDYCPIVAAVDELTGKRFTNHAARSAGKTIGLEREDAVEVMEAADCSIDYKQAVRAKLEAACCGQLD